MKKIGLKVSIFTYYKKGVKTIIKTNFSHYISSGVFFQLGNNRLLYFIAFFSKNFNLVKYNYEIYDKEILAIIKIFE